MAHKVIVKDVLPLLTHGDFVTVLLNDGRATYEIVLTRGQVSFLRDQLDGYLEATREPHDA